MHKKKLSITKRLIKWFVLVLLLISLIYLVLSYYVDQQLAKRADSIILATQCHKVWATRGLVDKQHKWDPSYYNSIASLQQAIDAGAAGSEVDLFFDPKLDRYIISHDRPYNLKHGKLLTLDELIGGISKPLFIWLDFKKMRKLTKPQITAAVNRLEFISQKYNFKDYFYIEGADPINLGYFRDSGFNTIFDIHPLPESKGLTSIIGNVYKMVYYFGDFTVVAMNSGDKDDPIYGETMTEIFKRIPLFIYHVPDDRELLIKISKNSDVRVLIQRDHTINNYDINVCLNPN